MSAVQHAYVFRLLNPVWLNCSFGSSHIAVTAETTIRRPRRSCELDISVVHSERGSFKYPLYGHRECRQALMAVCFRSCGPRAVLRPRLQRTLPTPANATRSPPMSVHSPNSTPPAVSLNQTRSSIFPSPYPHDSLSSITCSTHRFRHRKPRFHTARHSSELHFGLRQRCWGESCQGVGYLLVRRCHDRSTRRMIHNPVSCIFGLPISCIYKGPRRFRSMTKGFSRQSWPCWTANVLHIQNIHPARNKTPRATHLAPPTCCRSHLPIPVDATSDLLPSMASYSSRLGHPFLNLSRKVDFS